MKAKHKQAMIQVLLDHRDDDNAGWMIGMDLADELGWNSGRYYPTLYVLIQEGLVVTRKDPSPPPEMPHPRRQYRVDPDRVPELLEAFERQRKQATRSAPKRRFRIRLPSRVQA